VHKRSGTELTVSLLQQTVQRGKGARLPRDPLPRTADGDRYPPPTLHPQFRDGMPK